MWVSRKDTYLLVGVHEDEAAAGEVALVVGQVDQARVVVRGVRLLKSI